MTAGYISGPVTGAGAGDQGRSIGPERHRAGHACHLEDGSSGRPAHRAEGELPGIILGSRLAESIGAVVGKPVQLLVPNGQLTPFGPRPSYVRLRVAGMFESGFYDLDMNWAFMALPQVQKAFDLADVVNSIELMLDDIYQAPRSGRGGRTNHRAEARAPPPGGSRTANC